MEILIPIPPNWGEGDSDLLEIIKRLNRAMSPYDDQGLPYCVDNPESDDPRKKWQLDGSNDFWANVVSREDVALTQGLWPIDRGPYAEPDKQQIDYQSICGFEIVPLPVKGLVPNQFGVANVGVQLHTREGKQVIARFSDESKAKVSASRAHSFASPSQDFLSLRCYYDAQVDRLLALGEYVREFLFQWHTRDLLTGKRL